MIALILVAVVLHAKLRNEEYTVRRKPIVMTEDDLDWDDSAITITVNPLDAQEVCRMINHYTIMHLHIIIIFPVPYIRTRHGISHTNTKGIIF